ncbi:MAG TPA: sulfurtransferase [Vicinamibacterales bacterium]|nr:sulfurtransferase [Vicinamibacterales bacterium]
MFTTLIDAATLAAHLADPDWVVLDARFDLTAPEQGEVLYRAGHIPGARYVSLDAHLSGQKTGANGRHPLPSPEVAAATFASLGVSRQRQVVLYDADLGMFAARGWWILRWLGHERVAVLDGGLAAWQRAGLPVTNAHETWAPAVFDAVPAQAGPVPVTDVQAHLGDGQRVLVDARSADRFRGQNETLDPVGGHIPGAVNHFYQLNLTAEKTFKAPAQLRAEWSAVCGNDASRVVMYCGSGVTACHNLLALEHAGLRGARLFPGSWSEWCASPDRPTAAGD